MASNTRPPEDETHGRASAEWLLRLYVAGHTPKATEARASLKRICETHLRGQYEVEVVDLLMHSKMAKSDQIVAVPSLVRQLPLPLKRIIGSLANEERVLIGLEVQPAHALRQRRPDADQA